MDGGYYISTLKQKMLQSNKRATELPPEREPVSGFINRIVSGQKDRHIHVDPSKPSISLTIGGARPPDRDP